MKRNVHSKNCFLTRIALVVVFSFVLGACGNGESNVADCDGGTPGVPCSELSVDEKAQKAMEDGDYSAAITLLTDAVGEDPKNYDRYPLLAAAYAARAGFDIFDITKASFGGGGSLLETIDSFLPSPVELGGVAYDASLADMAASTETLQAIPKTYLEDENFSKYASSATLQLTLYQSAYSIMYLNKFAVSASTGSFDPAQLETMTDEDAVAILNSLAAAAGAQSGEQGEQLQSKINEALAAIENEEGGSKREKLIAYTQAQKGS